MHAPYGLLGSAGSPATGPSSRQKGDWKLYFFFYVIRLGYVSGDNDNKGGGGKMEQVWDVFFGGCAAS